MRKKVFAMKVREIDRDMHEKKIKELTEILESFDTEHRKKLVRLLQILGYVYEELSIPELLYGIVEKKLDIDSFDFDFRKEFREKNLHC
jgi:hypothetical protein